MGIEIKTNLSLEKETKGTFVYKNSKPKAPISTLYISKDAFEGETPPDEIRVIIKAKE